MRFPIQYLIIAIILSSAAIAQAQELTATAIASGNWSDPSIWSGGIVPNNGSPNATNTWNVIIDNGVSVTNNIPVTINKLKLGSNGGPSILGNAVQNINIVQEFVWEQGALGPAGFGEFTMLPGSVAHLTTSNLKQLRQNLTNRGEMTLSDGNLSANNFGNRITNESGGVFNMVGGRTLLLNNGRFRHRTGAVFNSLGSPFNLLGSMPESEPVVNIIQWEFESQPGATVNLETATRFNGGGSHKGDYFLADGVGFEFGGFGNQHDFQPNSITATSLKMKNTGATVNVQQFGSTILTITEFSAVGGTTNFNRANTQINNYSSSSGANVKTSGNVRFDGQAQVTGTALGGNGSFTFGANSEVNFTGSNLIQAPINQQGVVNFGDPNQVVPGQVNLDRDSEGNPYLWVYELGSVVTIKSPTRFTSTGTVPPNVLNHLFNVFDPSTAVIIDTLTPEMDVFYEYSQIDPGPLTPEQLAALESTARSFRGQSITRSSGPQRLSEEPEAPKFDIRRGRLNMTDFMRGVFDFVVHPDGTFLTIDQPALDPASRLMGNGRVVGLSNQDSAMLEWNAIIDPQALDSLPSILTIGSGLRLTETAELHFTLGTESDRLLVEGLLTLDGGLRLFAGDGFGPGMYLLIESEGIVANHGLSLLSAPSGFKYDLIFTSDSLFVGVNAIPEPSSMLLISTAVMVMLVRRRSRPTASRWPSMAGCGP